jgi:DNA-binding NtrC family response regulator
MVKEILLLHENGEASDVLKQTLNDHDMAVVEVKTFEEAKRCLTDNGHNVLVDRCHRISSEQFSILEFFKANSLKTRAVFLSQSGSVDDAVRLVKAGASDFVISKSLDKAAALAVLKSIMNDGTNAAHSAEQSAQPKPELVLIGQSQVINNVRTAVSLVAASRTPVLITGESGTGKEVVARLIHLQSDRSSRPFIALNCAAIPKDIIENELFGHEKGAYTGAADKKTGCFELANHGTLFFDEVAEMSPETQAKLLRAIETKMFRRLGGKDEIKVDVRTIAATNKRMAEALKSGEFREDLYYRFSVIEIYMPPLRERQEDIALLLHHFLFALSQQYKKPLQHFSNECIEILKAYDWPGNVRELRNIVERAVVTCKDEVITAQYLPDRLRIVSSADSTVTIPVGVPAREAERRFILQTLAAVGNHKTKAARLLGYSRKTLYSKLRKFAR